MISQLYIKNVAVIEEISIEFTGGFNVFTGETGAGKSILIDAIHAILGFRTSKGIIRYGEDRAIISAVFTDLNDSTKKLLSSLGYDPLEEVLIQRTIFSDGRNTCKIDNKPCTVSTLKIVGENLIDIHGQHDNGYLLDENKHQSIIDNYGNLEKDKEHYKIRFKELVKTKKELDKLLENDNDKEKQIEILKYQIDEITNADFKDGEKQEYLKLREQHNSSEKILRELSDSAEILNGENFELNIMLQMSKVCRSLENLMNVSDEFLKLFEQVNSVYYGVQEISEKVNSHLIENQINIDIDEVEDRLTVIQNIEMKYGDTLELVEKLLLSYQDKLEALENEDSIIDELENQGRELLEEIVGLSENLSDKRKKFSDAFLVQIKKELQFLNMPSVELSCQFDKTKLSSNGTDRIVIQISTNKGEPPKSISKVASGGELSRIMLAMKSIIAEKEEIQTLIFDEIDSGVSGSASEKIGIKLKETSRYNQVICVTHSPQIAAFADNHLYIKKEIDNDRTSTKVDVLDMDERKQELARIISGDNITKTAIDNAGEMLLLAQKKLDKPN